MSDIGAIFASQHDGKWLESMSGVRTSIIDRLVLYCLASISLLVFGINVAHNGFSLFLRNLLKSLTTEIH